MAPAYSRAQRWFEYGAIALYALLAAASAWRLVGAAGWGCVPVLAVALPLGWLATDLLSGLVHWACDSFGSVHTPLLGSAFIRPFREHHADPQAMTRHDFVETHGASCFAALPFLCLSCLLPLDAVVAQLLQAWLLAIGLAALATNQCHKWAHMAPSATPAAVRWAQRRGLILPAAHHRRHHTPPFDSHFCMSSGWLNPLFDAMVRKWR